MNNIMNFENKQVEVFEWNGQVLFNPKHVAECLDISDVNSSIRNFNDKQVIKLKNSDMHNMHIRNLNNAGENFLTESGVYKLIFKSKKAEAERFQDWVTDEVLPQIRKTGSYQALNTSELSPELQMFNQMFKAIANQEIEQKKIKAEIQDTKEQLQGIRDVVALTPNAWRKDTASLISKIAMKLGGFEHIKDVREESYKILNESYRVDIKRRLLNKQKNMALEGCSKSKISKVNYLDVIADDEKLINGYLSVVSKMAIKHGVDMN